MDNYGNMMTHGFAYRKIRIVPGLFAGWWVYGDCDCLAGSFRSWDDARRWAEDPAERVWDAEEEEFGKWMRDPESF